MWRRLISNSLHHTSGQPTAPRDHFFSPKKRRTGRCHRHPTHDGHAREVRVQRRGLLRQGREHHDRVRGDGTGADSAWFPSISELQVASTASSRGHAESVYADRRGCRDGIDPRRRRRTAPAPATRASSGTRTTGAAAGRSSTRVPGRGCSGARDMSPKTRRSIR